VCVFMIGVLLVWCVWFIGLAGECLWRFGKLFVCGVLAWHEDVALTS